jgi:predicted nucleotidyltransferase
VRSILGILAALHDADVDYVVVGGVAVVLRGHARMTVDLDLALDLTAQNLATALEVLTAEGLRPRLPVAAEQFADEETRTGWVEQRNLVAFTMHDPDNPLREVDLLATAPIPFADLAADADWITIDSVPVKVASVEHLVAMKRHSGRPIDLADIAALSALAERPIVERDDRDDP